MLRSRKRPTTAEPNAHVERRGGLDRGGSERAAAPSAVLRVRSAQRKAIVLGAVRTLRFVVGARCWLHGVNLFRVAGVLVCADYGFVQVVDPEFAATFAA